MIQTNSRESPRNFLFQMHKYQFCRSQFHQVEGEIQLRTVRLHDLQKKTQQGDCKMSIIPSFFNGRRSSIFDPFSLDVWDPFRDFPLQSSSDASRETSALVNTLVDWKETPEAHVFKADLPGIKKEEVKVEVEDDRVLQISGERNVEKEDKNDTWHRVERSSGKFIRRFRLPEDAKMDQVKASMENGVLTITIPKEEVKKPDVKSIQISATQGSPYFYLTKEFCSTRTCIMMGFLLWYLI